MIEHHLIFSHGYDKLKNEEYSTIRGKFAAKNYFAGQIVNIYVNGQYLQDAEIQTFK